MFLSQVDELNTAVNHIDKNVIGVQGDVSNPEDLDRLYDTVKQHKRRIDVLFTNSGVTGFLPLALHQRFLNQHK